MRNRIWITCTVLFALCLLLLLLKTMQHEKAVLPEQSEALTNQQPPSRAIQPQAAERSQITNVSALPPALMAEMVRRRTPEASNEIQERALAHWQVPIDFYGKVVDENSNAVAGADITFGWSEFPTEKGARRATAKSDAEGLFSLHNKRGPALDVWVSKEGYYASRGGQKGFSYMGAIEGFKPDPQNPVIFHLRKKNHGEPLVESDFPPGIGQHVQLRHDGTPIEIDLLNGQKAAAGAGQLKLELFRDVSEKNAKTFDWKLQIAIPGGGLVKTEDEFAFQPPESNYQPSVLIDMPKTNQNWREDITSKYYIQLPDGKYGRIDLYLLAYNGVFTIHSAVNPSGSRNLEPSN